jgi:hypothetical protein
MVERTLSWLVRRGHRRVAYRGVAPNRIWWSYRAAAVNLRPLLNLGVSRTRAGGQWPEATALALPAQLSQPLRVPSQSPTWEPLMRPAPKLACSAVS